MKRFSAYLVVNLVLLAIVIVLITLLYFGARPIHV
jgi:hypothetical protein